MSGAKRIAVAIACLALVLGAVKLVWQSGFDAGADVNGCIIASLIKYGDLSHGADKSEPACQRAARYEHHPLWLLRRRNGGAA